MTKRGDRHRLSNDPEQDWKERMRALYGWLYAWSGIAAVLFLVLLVLLGWFGALLISLVASAPAVLLLTLVWGFRWPEWLFPLRGKWLLHGLSGLVVLGTGLLILMVLLGLV